MLLFSIERTCQQESCFEVWLFTVSVLNCPFKKKSDVFAPKHRILIDMLIMQHKHAANENTGRGMCSGPKATDSSDCCMHKVHSWQWNVKKGKVMFSPWVQWWGWSAGGSWWSWSWSWWWKKREGTPVPCMISFFWKKNNTGYHPCPRDSVLPASQRWS